jgi:hypothetical protein
MTKRPMLFSELNTHEGAADQNLVGKLGDLGTIVVRMYKATLEPRKTSALKMVPKPLVADGIISEKNLRGQALSHQAM